MDNNADILCLRSHEKAIQGLGREEGVTRERVGEGEKLMIEKGNWVWRLYILKKESRRFS